MAKKTNIQKMRELIEETDYYKMKIRAALNKARKDKEPQKLLKEKND